uniref:Cilia and flagella associated protein 74 n=1 Tax=Sarcophilus harrisii TaxID=9305 RepID=G3VNF3_SARHA
MEREKNYELHRQKVISDAKKNHKIAVQFLKTTLAKVRNKKVQEEKLSQEHMKRRMDAVISLKNNITLSQDSIQKLRAWDNARNHLIMKKDEAEKDIIAALGGDALKQTLHDKQNMELEIRRRLFEEDQKLRKCEIVARLLKEEAYDEKMKQRQLDLENGKKRDDEPQGLCLLFSLATVKYWLCILLTYQIFDLLKSLFPISEETSCHRFIINTFKFFNLNSKLPKDEVERKPVGGSKMEQDILANTLEKLRSSIIHKQVVSGREFKGCPFYSKPDLIHFKDFDVGKTYKKKMTLINASFTINYCKLVGVEDHLKDFITILFDPPGPMSAGISCEVVIIFKPMINKDLRGNITFLAQSGSFSIPLKCTTKKCVLSLDKELIDFGSYVVGESVSRTITLENHGALGTKFQIHTNVDKCDLDIRSSNITEVMLYCKLGSLPSSISVLLSLFPEPKQEQNISTINEHAYEGTDINYEDQTEIKLGEITTSEIEPFGSVKIPIIFTPVIPGSSEARFQLTFKNPDCPPLCFTAVGVAIIVPVWVPKPNVDLKICMYDRLYQDAVIIQTRSKAALRLKFEVCPELQKHIELLPETGYIQAQSSFSVQLKFLPKLSLPEDAGEYFDPETRVLEAPMTIRVADQKRPVKFTVHAIVTTSDLEIEPKELNFGYVTIYEAVYTTITLTNKSLLPQEFGFISVPKFVEIQPNDGFGVIRPLQSLPLDVIFKPIRAKEYDFQLNCISEINREFPLSIKAIGVHPPLELSHYRIKFRATPLFDMSAATLYVINSHTNMNSLTHAVPRIGTGDIAPVGPTSFEFILPDKAPLMIIPSVGTVWPGKKCMIEVIFKPEISETTIKTEVVKMRNRKRQTKMKLKPKSSEEYAIAKATLSKDFQEEFKKYVIPCVVASGDIKEKKETELMYFSPYNILYLELYCPSVNPSVIVASDDGKTLFNFGDIALQFSLLNPYGPFILLCPCRGLQPNESQDIVVSFSPRESNTFLENLEIISKKGTLTLRMLGKGVASTITCSIEGDVLNMGYVIAGESATTTFKLQNSSTLPIKYSIVLDSLSLMRNKEQLQMPGFIGNKERKTNIIGTQNYNGHCVFSVSPTDGIMEAGKIQDFTLTFSPDHESLYYSDRMQVVLFNKRISHQILLKGAAREHMMFVEGGDPLDVTVESLAIIPLVSEEEKREEEMKALILTLEYMQQDSAFTPATRELQVGCIRTTQPTQKKPDKPLVLTTFLTLRGDVREIYRIVFIVHVVSE